MGGTIVMGRRTWESIGRVLPGRRMVVITGGDAPLPPNVRRVRSLEEAIAEHAAEKELFVIGGARVFDSALPRADRIILTEIDLDPPGDVFFHEPDPAAWLEQSRVPATSVNGTRFSIITYTRRRD
jgi:dihydrofolate reductase